MSPSKGAEFLARLEASGWTRPPDSLPREVPETPQQLARKRWLRSFPGGRAAELERDDPLRDRARLTPDDREVVVDAAGLA